MYLNMRWAAGCRDNMQSCEPSSFPEGEGPWVMFLLSTDFASARQLIYPEPLLLEYGNEGAEGCG